MCSRQLCTVNVLMVCKSSSVGKFMSTDGAGNVTSFECSRHEISEHEIFFSRLKPALMGANEAAAKHVHSQIRRK